MSAARLSTQINGLRAKQRAAEARGDVEQYKKLEREINALLEQIFEVIRKRAEEVQA